MSDQHPQPQVFTLPSGRKGIYTPNEMDDGGVVELVEEVGAGRFVGSSRNLVALIVLLLGMVAVSVGVGAHWSDPWLGVLVGGSLLFIVGLLMAASS